MKLEEVRQRAANIGLQGINRIKKADLVRAIQQREGNQSCFGASWREECRELDCCWRDDCLSTLSH